MFIEGEMMELDNFTLIDFDQLNSNHEYVMQCIFDVSGSRFLKDYINLFSRCSADDRFVNKLYIIIFWIWC